MPLAPLCDANGKPRLFGARLAGLVTRKPPKRGPAPDRELTYPAQVVPAARPVDDLPPDERPDNLVRNSGWVADDIRVEIGSLNNPPDGFPYLVGGDIIRLRYGTYEAPEVVLKFLPDFTLEPDVAVFRIPRANLGEAGEYRSFEMQYTIIYTGGQDTGPRQLISVDNTPPAGGTEPANLIFDPDIVANGITPLSFTKEGDEEFIQAVIPRYAGIKPGDIITGSIDGNGQHREDEVRVIAWGESGDVAARFKRAFVETFTDGSYDFQYEIEGREELSSGPSSPVHLRILLRDYIGDLVEPGVEAYDDDTDKQLIDEQDARAGVTVSVPSRPELTTAHSVSVLWGAYLSTAVRIVDPARIDIQLPYSTVLADWNARNPSGGDTEIPTNVSYTVFKGDLKVGVSPAHVVVVNLHTAGGVDPDPGSEANDNLVAPVVRPDSGEAFDNRIPLRDEDLPASIRIEKKDVDGEAVFEDGDIVTVRYGATATLTPYPIKPADLADLTVPLQIELPWSVIKAGGAGTKQVAYWTERLLVGGGKNTSKSPGQDVVVETRDALPGGGELEVAILPEFFLVAPFPDPVIGRDRVLNGTPIGIPEYTVRDRNDEIEVFAAVVPRPAYQHRDDETPVAGFGAEETDADRGNWFKLSDTTMRPADPGPVDEGDGTLRPPIEERHILFQIPADRFPGIEDESLSNFYHIHLRYRIKNAVGATESKVLLVSVDTRGTVTPPDTPETSALSLQGIKKELIYLTGRLRDFERLAGRWLGLK